MAKEDRFLNTEEVAEMLQVDEQTIRRWIKSGKLQASKPGREWKIPQSALDSLLENYSSPKALSISPEAPESHGGEVLPEAENPWKAQYEEYANTLFYKWEGEIEGKMALADNEPVKFLGWVQDVRDIGNPCVRGLMEAYDADSEGFALEAVLGGARVVGRWADLWRRIEETTSLSEEDERRLLEMAEETKSIPKRYGNA